jgi:hypothetical protein
MILAMNFYLDDSGGKLISYYTVGAGAANDDLWIARLEKYYTARQNVRCCPAAPAPTPAKSWKQPKGSSSGYGTADYPWLWDQDTAYVGSYGINGWCYGDAYQEGYGSQNAFFKKLAAIPYTTKTPLFL